VSIKHIHGREESLTRSIPVPPVLPSRSNAYVVPDVDICKDILYVSQNTIILETNLESFSSILIPERKQRLRKLRKLRDVEKGIGGEREKDLPFLA